MKASVSARSTVSPRDTATADGSPPPALQSVCSELGTRKLVPLPGGGSPALVWVAETHSDDLLVIKFLDAAAGSVDGHDLRTFLRKPQQMARVHADLPQLSPFYAQVMGEWNGPGWAAYATPYYEGVRATAPLRREDPDVPGFLAALRGVMKTLTEHGYAAGDWPAPSSHFRALHIDRVRRRLPLLRAHLDPSLFEGAGVWVNGRHHPPLMQLLDMLGGDHGLLSDLQPTRLNYPVHGDINLGNLVMQTGRGFILLDPRGMFEPWDVVYDMAKVLFSLTIHEPAMEEGFVIARESARSGAHFRVSLRRPRPTYFAAAARLPDLLGSLPFFSRLDRVDPCWRKRLAFAHASHCLAEAACRLSDRKQRDFGATRGWAACLELACGLLLTGLALLDDLLTGGAPNGLAALEEIACPGGVVVVPPAGESGAAR